MILQLELSITWILDFIYRFKLNVIPISGFMYRTTEPSLQNLNIYLMFKVGYKKNNYYTINDLYVKDLMINTCIYQSVLKNTLFNIGIAAETFVIRHRPVITFDEILLPYKYYPPLTNNA